MCVNSFVHFVVILQILLVSPVWSETCYNNNGYQTVCYDEGFAVGIIIAIIIGAILTIIIPIILCCYCMGLCCFVGRRGDSRGQVYANPIVSTVQSPYQHPNVIVNSNYQPGSTPYPPQPQGQVYYQPQQYQPPQYQPQQYQPPQYQSQQYQPQGKPEQY